MPGLCARREVSSCHEETAPKQICNGVEKLSPPAPPMVQTIREETHEVGVGPRIVPHFLPLLHLQGIEGEDDTGNNND